MLHLNNVNKTGFVLVLFLCITICGGCKRKSYIESQSENSNVKDVKLDDKKADKSRVDLKPGEIYVDVEGAVQKAGVYKLKSGSRIYQAIKSAGGLREDASIQNLNQAELLEDGQKIYIFSQNEYEAEQQKNVDSGDDKLVNLNTATADELMTLPGVGKSKADSIIKFREEQGCFKTKKDLMKIPGIKQGVFSKLENLIKVD
jgi:competence protein ComEA